MPRFQLGPNSGGPDNSSGANTKHLQPSDTDRIPLQTPATADASGVGDVPAYDDTYSPPTARTRDFPNTWDTSPSVVGPMGKMNVGYTHNVVSKNGQWARGELPDLGYGYYFALRRPRFMREPRTDLGSYNFARG